VAGDLQLWGDAFGGVISELLDLQEQIVEGVERAIRQSVEAAEIDRARRKPACDLGSRDLVLRALPLVLAADPASAQRALGLLEDAITLDPDDPASVALAGWCRMQRVMYAVRGGCALNRQGPGGEPRGGVAQPGTRPLLCRDRRA